ncbi:hypothetical protein BB559_001863 [Furculomyces boomerangus]|uniref:Bromo domain-containing protein n=1 Tax=Furculomyces boomerangus TaxID=61424 RepID=A0A2T9YZX5_9FUNG|nr:hypothetical protein BB559_001863 [Furculomyces boomerangus]
MEKVNFLKIKNSGLDKLQETQKWIERTYEIALEINSKNLWKNYIRKEQFHHLVNALISKEKWMDFMKINKEGWIYKQFDNASQQSNELDDFNFEASDSNNLHKTYQYAQLDDMDLENSNSNSKSPEKVVDSKHEFSRMLAAINARAVVFEYYVSALYPLDCEKCETNESPKLIEALRKDISDIFRTSLGTKKVVANLKNDIGTNNLDEDTQTDNEDERHNFDSYTKTPIERQGLYGLEVDDSKTIRDSLFKMNEEDYDSSKNNSNTNSPKPIFVNARSIDEFDNYDDADEEVPDSKTQKLDDAVDDIFATEKTPEENNESNIPEQWLLSPTEKSDRETNFNFLKTESSLLENKKVQGLTTDISNEKTHTSQSDGILINNTNDTSHVKLEPKEKLLLSVGFTLHTLEDDLVAVEQQNKWKSTKDRIQKFIESQEAERKNDSLVNQLGSISNIKNLANFIDSNRDKVALSTVDLTNMLSEVRPKKSKWSSDEFPELEELYTGLEHVLSELRGMGSISLPFLSQVKRRDAPDYYDVIKNPMDLGAMARKLKNHNYHSKKEFEDDVRLIRNNCYEYNTAPNNPYRKQADMIMKKAENLLVKVTDIVIPDRMILDNDDERTTEFGDESDSGTFNDSKTWFTRNRGLNDTDSVHSNSATRGKIGNFVPSPLHISTKNNYTISHNINKEGTEEKDSLDHKDALEQDKMDIDNINAENHVELDLGLPKESVFTLKTEHEDQNYNALSEVLIKSCGTPVCIEKAIWETKSKFIRAEKAQDSLKRKDSDFGMQLALIRNVSDMQKSLNESHMEIVEIEEDEIDFETDIFKKAEKLEKQLHDTELDKLDLSTASFSQRTKLSQLMKEHKKLMGTISTAESSLKSNSRIASSSSYNISGGIPDRLSGCTYKPVDIETSQKSGLRLLSDKSIGIYESARFPRNEMWKSISNSVDYLHKIRKVDNKINTIKFNLSVGYYGGNQADGAPVTLSRNDMKDFELDINEDDHEFNKVNEIDDNYDLPAEPVPPLTLNHKTGASLMKRTCALLFAQAGFEKFTNPALSLTSEVVIEYLLNLGHTLRSYIDIHSKSMSNEAILAHCLHENGVENLDDLTHYVDERVKKTELKLEDVLKKLKFSFKELVSGAVTNQIDSAGEFSNEDSYMNGELASLGDDFFGFHELGLDKEFGVDINKGVPVELWFGKPGSKLGNANMASSIQSLKYIPPPLWSQVVDTKNQIGLFLPFLSKKFNIDGPKFTNEQESLDIKSEDDQIINVDPYLAIEEYHKANKNTFSNLEPLVEDEVLPPKGRFGFSSRPKVPPQNHLTLKTLPNSTSSNAKNAKKQQPSTTMTTNTDTGFNKLGNSIGRSNSALGSLSDKKGISVDKGTVNTNLETNGAVDSSGKPHTINISQSPSKVDKMGNTVQDSILKSGQKGSTLFSGISSFRKAGQPQGQRPVFNEKKSIGKQPPPPKISASGIPTARTVGKKMNGPSSMMASSGSNTIQIPKLYVGTGSTNNLSKQSRGGASGTKITEVANLGQKAQKGKIKLGEKIGGKTPIGGMGGNTSGFELDDTSLKPTKRKRTPSIASTASREN